MPPGLYVFRVAHKGDYQRRGFLANLYNIIILFKISTVLGDIIRGNNTVFHNIMFQIYNFSSFPSQEALKLDRQPLDGRPVYVNAYSKDATSRGRKIDNYFTAGLEKHKLFVRNLTADTNEHEIRVCSRFRYRRIF